MPAPVASGWSDVAGWASHPLESAALSRRTPLAVIQENREPAGSAGKPPFYRTFAPGEANLYPVDPISTRGALELILERHWREEGRAGSDGRNSKNDYVR